MHISPGLYTYLSKEPRKVLKASLLLPQGLWVVSGDKACLIGDRNTGTMHSESFLAVGSGGLDSFYIDCVFWAFIQTLYRGPGYPLVPRETTITLLTLHSLMPVPALHRAWMGFLCIETRTPTSTNTVATEMTFKKHLCKGCARDRRWGRRLKPSLLSSENFRELLHSEASVSSHLPHRQQEPSSWEWWRQSTQTLPPQVHFLLLLPPQAPSSLFLYPTKNISLT